MKAIPCKYDGIKFRSRLEASWYVYFKRLGFSLLHEANAYEVESIADYNDDGSYGPVTLNHWLPDFFLSGRGIDVEIKPILPRYGLRDAKSIASAYVIGYDHPTMVILGSPFEFLAVLIFERRKGSPYGEVLDFGPAGTMTKICDWYVNCYPDETDEWTEDSMDFWFKDPRFEGDKPSKGTFQKLAAEAWGATQWNPPVVR